MDVAPPAPGRFLPSSTCWSFSHRPAQRFTKRTAACFFAALPIRSGNSDSAIFFAHDIAVRHVDGKDHRAVALVALVQVHHGAAGLRVRLAAPEQLLLRHLLVGVVDARHLPQATLAGKTRKRNPRLGCRRWHGLDRACSQHRAAQQLVRSREPGVLADRHGRHGRHRHRPESQNHSDSQRIKAPGPLHVSREGKKIDVYRVLNLASTRFFNYYLL